MSLDARWGPHTVDSFSSYFSSQIQLQIFFSGCSAVDALAQDWGSDNNWLCPPVHHIVAAVEHLRYQQGDWYPPSSRMAIRFFLALLA